MNGRIYDPTLGRFLQADPFIQAPKNSQSYNRYAYVFNNPLKYIDPSGYSAWTKFRDKFIKPIIAIAISVYLPGSSAIFGSFAGGFGATVASGALAGYVTTGSLKGALTGAFTAGAFYGVGSAFEGVNTSFASAGHMGKVLAHGVTGGIMSVLQGGKFGHGFAAAGMAQFAAPGIDGIDAGTSGVSIQRVLVAAVVGGTTSAITGGKFANGAITGAFSRAFNDDAHPNKLSPREKILVDLKKNGASFKQLLKMKSYIESLTDNPGEFSRLTGIKGADVELQYRAFEVQKQLSLDLMSTGLAEGIGNAEFIMKTATAIATRDISGVASEMNSYVTSNVSSHILTFRSMGRMYLKAYYE